MKELDTYSREINESYGGVKFQNTNIDIPLKEKHNISIPAHFLSIDPAHKKEILQKIINFKISDDVKYFVQEYEKFFEERNRFEWKWLGTVFKDAGVTLSTVDEKYLDSITDCKILLCLLYIMVDDVAEVRKDEKLLNEMLMVLNNNTNVEITEKNEKLLLLKNLWEYLLNKISKLPRFEEFKDIFMYDFKQVLNSAEYSFLINKNPELINSKELEIYDSHGMVVFLVNGIDLMASPTFNKKELAHLRTVFWHSQQMARIGNSLVTWKREIKEKDFSSGVLGYALSKKIVDLDDFEKLNEKELINRIENSDVFQRFIKKWESDYLEIISIKENIKSVDLGKYIKGLENVLKFHMACEGNI